jgi:hypothetical protein
MHCIFLMSQFFKHIFKFYIGSFGFMSFGVFVLDWIANQVNSREIENNID